MTTTDLQVVFRTEDKKDLPAIPGLSPQQCLDHYSLTYPSLTTATVAEPVIKGNMLVYNIEETLGTKG